MAEISPQEKKFHSRLVINKTKQVGFNVVFAAVFFTSESSFARLKVDRYSINFAKVIRGQKLKHKFLFSNTGNKEEKIHAIHQPCSCTHIKGENNYSFPAHSKKIAFEVELDSSQLKGRVAKKIYLYTSANSKKYIILTLKAEVQEEFQINPPILDLRKIIQEYPIYAMAQ